MTSSSNKLASTVWCVTVTVPDNLVPHAQTLGFAPVPGTASEYSLFRKSDKAMLYIITKCKKLGIKGHARRIDSRFAPRRGKGYRKTNRKNPKSPLNKFSVDRSGFGGRLNAAPIKGQWRLRQRKKP
jgi:hypothetical protein